MTIRLFPIKGTHLVHGHCVVCPLLACRAVDSHLDRALTAVRQQIVARWADAIDGLPVRMEVSTMGFPLPSTRPGIWETSIVVITNETPMTGITLEHRLGLPWDAQLARRLAEHQSQATSVAAYQEVLIAIDWYLAQPTIPRALQTGLHTLRLTTETAISILSDDRAHMREHTRPYHRPATEDGQYPWN